METSNRINDYLESFSRLPWDDQLMVSEIILKRIIEEKRKKLAASVKDSKIEYYANKAKKGSVDESVS